MKTYSKVKSVPFDALPEGVKKLAGKKLKTQALKLLERLPENSTSCVFFDPQYRGVMDKMNYGNEKTGDRSSKRANLPQMTNKDIVNIFESVGTVLAPNGYVFLWVDTHHLMEGDIKQWLPSDMRIVDMIVWDKLRIGMGYRSRRSCEFLVVCQKHPCNAKGTWTNHGISDVWKENKINHEHPHVKPQGLIETIISSVVPEGGLVVDPCAGSFIVKSSAEKLNRKFIGCDLVYGTSALKGK